ncbi:MAG: tRNA pseudouridine(55) synthase TruB [Treponemataceae bacterium]
MKKNSFVLYAKPSGLTSFSSLNVIKNALETKKVGHTGTLDNFADGLLVVMINKLTRLVSHVTNFDKKYEAIIRFGSETDTLDYTGTVFKETKLPRKEDFLAAVNQFLGEIDQIPPAYSAIHVNGKRASDLARNGLIPQIPSRTVTIFDIQVIDFTGEYAHIFVHCSKGTYIRSLARDIAASCKSCGHLVALRRTAVGSFTLDTAIGQHYLPSFSIDNLLQLQKNQSGAVLNKESLAKAIIEGQHDFTKEVATICNFNTITLQAEYEKQFFSGMPLKRTFFVDKKHLSNNDFLVFLQGSQKFCGSIKLTADTIAYNFVM